MMTTYRTHDDTDTPPTSFDQQHQKLQLHVRDGAKSKEIYLDSESNNILSILN
jgi:hypothetical protein